ncbi:MAG: sigma-54-dependent Fis family transcriptional regulator [Pyrinomonadaceae bacterium]|nr:sigma-54-dependent Fis family transcriptional regulator [Pyrinomonadaceae bacterium]
MMSETAQSLSLERKIKMHEARESIITRLALAFPTTINLDRFLNVIVSELGRMMSVDRCDVIQLTSQSELRISHEWRASTDVPSSLDTVIPLDLKQLSEHVDITKPIRLDDTSRPGLDQKVRFLAASLGTRSLLVVPVVLGDDVLGLVGMHTTRTPRAWLDDEVSFLESVARQIAVGYQYTRLYTDKEREADTKRALLEIANALNARSDFREVSSLVLERAISLVGADYSALGVLDPKGGRISLAAFKAAPHATTDSVQGLIDAHGQSLDVTEFPAAMEVLAQGKTFRLLDTHLPFPFRLIFNATLGGRAALVAPVRVGGQVFGLLGLVWSEARDGFQDHEVALVEGIADQIGTALERDQLSAEVMHLRSALHERYGEDRIIGQTPAIRRAMELALSVADTQTTVLIQGESGTGKELLANLIHYNSGRENHPYVKLNCGAIPETLLESELFGHEKGAFTDASARRRGRFEEANGGTLFLDEVGEMSLSAQVRLLRVLQDGEFTRVGGNEVLKADVRVIAASNVDLERATELGTFRRDLYYRLSVFPIVLPPLRERRSDVHPLIISFLERYTNKTGRFVSGISKDAVRALVNYDWPGNVRELENAIERSVIIASGRQIEMDDLPESIRLAPSNEREIKLEIEVGPSIEGERREFIETGLDKLAGKTVSARAVGLVKRTLYLRLELKNLTDSVTAEEPEGGFLKLEIDLPSSIEDLERKVIEATLDYTDGDKSHAARVLGIGRKTLYRKLAQYNGSPRGSE